jgi:hypothetical protein
MAIGRTSFVSARRANPMDIKSVIIGVLSVAVIVLGYLYWDAQQTKVKVDLPGIKIEGR